MTGPAPLPLPDALSLSGLTRAQIGRLFGLDYRQVASWLRTGQVPAPHQPQAERVCASVTEALTKTSSATARAVLLDSSNGRSVYHQLLAAVPDQALLQLPPFTPSEMVS